MAVDPSQIAQAPASAGPADAPVEQPVVFDVAAIAEENARLRAELLAENERLRAALADSQAAGLTFQGLTDEDVRKLEHPEEFVLDQNAEFSAKLAELHAKIDAVHAANAQVAPVEHVEPSDPFAGATVDELQAALDAKRAGA
jgi:hypothetical protein